MKKSNMNMTLVGRSDVAITTKEINNGTLVKLEKSVYGSSIFIYNTMLVNCEFVYVDTIEDWNDLKILFEEMHGKAYDLLIEESYDEKHIYFTERKTKRIDLNQHDAFKIIKKFFNCDSVGRVFHNLKASNDLYITHSKDNIQTETKISRENFVKILERGASIDYIYTYSLFMPKDLNRYFFTSISFHEHVVTDK